MTVKITQQKDIVVGIFFLVIVIPFLSSSFALVLGILFSLFISQPSFARYKSLLLQGSIVFMGFGMDLQQVIRAGVSGFGITFVSVTGIMMLGLLLGRLGGIKGFLPLFISSGTAICGGSAIASVASVVQGKDEEVSLSLIVVFILNAAGLILFPQLGRIWELDQVTFGKWAAIAIHDTSSVVGAGAAFGEKALEVATTVKLVRALWIIPLSLMVALCYPGGGKIRIPWFIFLYVMAIMTAHLLPQMNPLFVLFKRVGRRGMVGALFLIGLGLKGKNLQKAGIRTFVYALILWIITAGASLAFFL